MKKHQQELEPCKFYNILNRGNNSEKIFFKRENYEFFLRRYTEYVSDCIDTYAFCLMPNHFHFLVRVKEKALHPNTKALHPNTKALHPNTKALHPKDAKLLASPIPTQEDTKDLHPDSKDLHLAETKPLLLANAKVLASPTPTQAFHRLFTSYCKAINKQENRHGSLIENPFKRIEIDSGEYFTNLILYIHTNPQLHGFVNDFRTYLWSSYNIILNDSPSVLQKAYVLEQFGDKDNYRFCHQKKINLVAIEQLTFD
jgi:hypothetical protein